MRHPPPAFHVGHNDVDAPIGLAAVKLGGSSVIGIKVAGTKFRQLGFEREIGLRVRLVGVERLADVLGFDQSGENLAWIRCASVVENIAAHA